MHNKIIVLTTLLICVLVLNTSAQNVASATIDTGANTFFYKGVVALNGSQHSIASKAYWWWAQNHIEDEEYVHYKDLEGGHFVAHGYFTLDSIAKSDKLNVHIWYTLYFSSKDNAYQYFFSNVFLTCLAMPGGAIRLEKKPDYLKKIEEKYPISYQNIYQKVDTQFNGMIENMKVDMAKPETW